MEDEIKNTEETPHEESFTEEVNEVSEPAAQYGEKEEGGADDKKKKGSRWPFGKKDEAPNEEMEKLSQELGETRDKYLRLYAEFDNFRRRSIRDRAELEKVAAKNTITAILPVVDDFARAMKTAEAGGETMPEGVRLVHHKFLSVLETLGLTEMVSTGENFDVEKFEAVTEFPAPTEELKGKVIDTIEKGYYLNDSIIRFAKVVVGK